MSESRQPISPDPDDNASSAHERLMPTAYDELAHKLDQLTPRHEPGILHLWLLDQTKIWVNVYGQEIQLMDMDDDYLANVIWMLRDRSYQLLAWGRERLIDHLFEAQAAQDAVAEAVVERELLELYTNYADQLDPATMVEEAFDAARRWVDDRPLVQAMVNQIGYDPTQRAHKAHASKASD